MKLSQFKFKLPEEQIAQYPAHNRDESRLMVLHKKSETIEHREHFKDIIDYFDDKDAFIFNDTKVFPARLYGNKEKTGARIEVFLLRELNEELRLWDVLVDPARKIRIGNKLYFGEDDSMVAEVIDNTTSRGRTLRFLYDGPHDEFKAAATAAMVRYQELYSDTDPDMHLILGTCPLQPTALSYTSSQNLISFLRALPNGVIRMSHDYENVVETSCNLSMVRTKPDAIAIALLARSLKDHGLDDVIDKLDCICSLLDNVDVGFTGRTFGWTSPKDNRLIEILKHHYKEQAQLDIAITSIHAGLETGYFAKANPSLQMVSLGPTVRNAHSPDEYCSVEHTKLVYHILRSTLAEL